MHYGPGHDLSRPPYEASWPTARRPYSKLRLVATVAALFLGATAAIGSVANLQRPAAEAQAQNSVTPLQAPHPSSTQPATPTSDSTATEDRAVCTAIAPLMAEIDRFSNAYIDLGDSGTPARDAALPKYVSDTQTWVGKVQSIVDQHPAMDPRLLRTLQRYLDDQRLLTSDMVPGRMHPYQEDLWADSLGAYSGPLHRCDEVGVRW